MFAQFSDEEIIKAFDIYRQNDAKYITVNDLRYAVKQLNQDISNEELQVNWYNSGSLFSPTGNF